MEEALKCIAGASPKGLTMERVCHGDIQLIFIVQIELFIVRFRDHEIDKAIKGV